MKSEMQKSELRLQNGRATCTQDRNGPLADGMRFPAIQAFGHGELGRALRADATGLEGVECLPTFAALPEFRIAATSAAVQAAEKVRLWLAQRFAAAVSAFFSSRASAQRPPLESCASAFMS
jgi:hypothetical protein